MTVSTEINHEEYVGNGVTSVFPYRFRILKASNMVVVSIAPNGTETTLILNTGFTVSGVGSYAGGNVTLPNPLPEGWGLTLTRVLPAIQETDLRNQGTFFAETHEDAFDYLTMLIQQVGSWFTLALRKPTFLSKFYDAKKNRIANLADPVSAQDAVTKGYADSVVQLNLNKTLRVPESFIEELPDKISRSGKLLAFNDQGRPIVVLPESGSAADVLVTLASIGGYSYLGELQSVADFIGFVKQDGARVNLKSWHKGWAATAEGKPVGGGSFIYRANVPKAKHNGGTHISPTVPWDGLQSSIAAYLTGAGETDPTGLGCWVRDYQCKVNLTWFGTRGDGATDDVASIQAFRDYLVSQPKKKKGYIPAGVYSHSSGPNWAVKGIHLVGDGKHNTILKCTASTRAFNIDASEYGQAVVYDVVVENLCIEGHVTCQNLLYVENTSHITMRNVNSREANPLTGTALKLLFTVASVFENFTCSINEQAMVSRPYYGIHLGVSPSRNLKSTCNQFKNAIIEGVNGTGIRLTSADLNMFTGGTSEANGLYGITLDSGSRMNTFMGMGLESNPTADILDGGTNTVIKQCYTGTAIILLNTSKRAQISGGLHERIETQTGCDSAEISNLTINYFKKGNGGYVDNGTATAWARIWDEILQAYVYPKKPRTAITVGATPFTYSNDSRGFESVLMVGGNVTQILFKRDADTANMGTSSGPIFLAPGDQLVISYSTAPVMSRIPMGENYT
ncbi:glycosyl hydrolase family 28-related protein [Yersinia kristensenii]|uniref:Tail fiber n=1 Tax=Yersinia kristensenii TaxID=28152 RepID=A0A0T9LAQ1_YERKR|nr:glycosyl hydrolase family 28-related protein [Yersinia kristensenii]CNE70467.1 Tail fiber [Yersinia kristensenii]